MSDRMDVFRQNERDANRYTAVCTLAAAGVALLMWLLNSLDFFIVDKSMMNLTMPIGTALFALPFVMVKCGANSGSWLKYLIMLCFLRQRRFRHPAERFGPVGSQRHPHRQFGEHRQSGHRLHKLHLGKDVDDHRSKRRHRTLADRRDPQRLLYRHRNNRCQTDLTKRPVPRAFARGTVKTAV